VPSALATPFPGDAVRFRPSCLAGETVDLQWLIQIRRLGGLCCCPRPLALAGGPCRRYCGDGGLRMRNLRLGCGGSGPHLWSADLEYQVNVLIELLAVGGNLAGKPVLLSLLLGQGRQLGGLELGGGPGGFLRLYTLP